MSSISSIKKTAKAVLKRNYWILIFICAALLYLEIIPGTGTTFMSLQKASLTEQEAEALAEEEEAYKPGLIRYLDSIYDGKSKEQQKAIAEEVLESFNGRGGNVYGILRGIDRFVFSNDSAAKLLIVLSTIIYLIWVYMIKNQIATAFCRISMDAQREDHKIHFSDLFVIFRSKGFGNVAKVMALWAVSLDLILLTGLVAASAGTWYATNGGSVALVIVLYLVAAAIIAYYGYRYFVWALVPYILASNPDASCKKVFALSKSMMHGYKLSLLKLRLSFLGWDVLAILTLGLVDLFFLTPMLYMSYGCFYMELREKALAENMPNCELIRGDEIALRLNDLEESKFGKMIKDRNPLRHYDLVNIVLFFFIFAFIGWCWEVLIHIVKDGVFVNRGTMHGPWLPIYGFGGAGIIFFLRRFAKKPWLLVATIFVGCGVLEYVAHWYLEVTKGTKWWDYSNYFLNLNGRICFEGLFVFCLAGVFAVYVAGPALDNLLNRISKKTRWTIAGILLVIFGCDMIYSHKHPNMGKGITDYGKK